jgi:hypothetical protein
MPQLKNQEHKLRRFCEHLPAEYAGPALPAIFQCRSFLRTAFLFGLFAALCAGSSSAQTIRVRPAASRIQPNLVLTGSLSLSVSAPTVNFTLTHGGAATGTPDVTITSSWSNLTGVAITYNVYGYFSSSTAALTNTSSATYVIPSSAVHALVGGANSNVTSDTTFSTATPFSGASGLDLITVGNLLNLLGTGSFSNTLTLKIDLSSQPNLPAGTYTGTLNITAQAI